MAKVKERKIEELHGEVLEIRYLVQHNDYVLGKIVEDPIKEGNRAIYGIYKLNKIVNERLERLSDELEKQT